MYERKKTLFGLSRVIKKRIDDNNITIQDFAHQHCVQHGLSLSTLNRYLYANNAPGVLMCWKIAESLCNMTAEPVELVFMELAQAIRNKKTPD